MSGSNAISGITIIGALVAVASGNSTLTTVLGSVALAFATINVVGGFLVTNRMLQKFKKGGRNEPVSRSSVDAAYLLAAVLFIVGLKGLSHPRSAVRGNLLGALAMLIAIVVTLVDQQVLNWVWIVAGIAADRLSGRCSRSRSR